MFHVYITSLFLYKLDGDLLICVFLDYSCVGCGLVDDLPKSQHP